MSYVTLSTGEIAASEPVTNTLLQKVKDNADDHEDRIADLENGSNIDYPPIIMRVNGPYGDIASASRTGYLKTTANFSFNITGVRLYIDVAGSGGTTEIDLKLSIAGAAYASVMTTKPSVTSATGNDGVSSNGVVNGSNKLVSAGDILRLDITGVQTGTPKGFMVRIDYVKV